MKKCSICAVALFLSVFFLIISFSVAIPIIVRPIYYTQLNKSNMETLGPYSKEQIKEAYDDILDFLTLKKKDFSCGQLKFSKSGQDHFKDCRNLFVLDFSILSISATITIILLLLKNRCNLYLGKFYAFFYSGFLAIIMLIIISLFSIYGFDYIFIIFHKIFFIGKTNWYFDAYTDEIIYYLPESFFLKCAVIIGICIFILSALCIIIGLKSKKRLHKKRK